MAANEARYAEVETIVQSLEKTQDFLEKLLWWSRSQLVNWIPSWSKISLERVFSETAKIVDPQAAMKDIQLEFPAPVAVDLMADEECLTLILANLITNAIKFSHPGSPVRLETAEARNSFELVVIDQGIGMSERVLERLFVIENKLSTQGTGGETGSGMGLILAQSLAQRNDGGLELASEPGKGTRATLWLPLRKG
jgi:signal transduction histidine kinase